MNGLTVIATHEGWDYIEECLDAEKKFGKWPVVVVDTCSSTKYAKHLLEMCNKRGDFKLMLQSIPNYDFGAYIAAANEYKDYDAYWFKHDSLYLKSPQFYDVIESSLKDMDFVGWHFFAKWGSSFDNEEQRQWLIEKFGTDDYDYGFYGPNIAMKRKTFLEIQDDIKDIIIDSKMKQQAMERGWSIIGKKRKMAMMFLEQYKGDVQSENYTFFRKATHNSGVPRQ
jgi:hypothetical protein